MEDILEKKLKDITFAEINRFLKTFGKKKPIKPNNEDLERIITNVYTQGNLYSHYIKFSEIYQSICEIYTPYLSKKELSNTLVKLGFTSKVKAIKGGSTARFYYIRLKENYEQ